MRPPPTRMRDRWADRPELPDGTAALVWHVLLGTDPAVQAAAADVRHALRDVDGLHLTPPEWLHMTMFLADITTDAISHAQLGDAVADVADGLLGLPPIEASVGRIRYYPEAIALAVEPVPTLRELHERVRTSSERVFRGFPASPTEKWFPHVTVAYSTADQPTAPIIHRLGDHVPPRRFTIDAVSLVVQTGAERSWIWEPTAHVRLSAS